MTFSLFGYCWTMTFFHSDATGWWRHKNRTLLSVAIHELYLVRISLSNLSIYCIITSVIINCKIFTVDNLSVIFSLFILRQKKMTAEIAVSFKCRHYFISFVKCCWSKINSKHCIFRNWWINKRKFRSQELYLNSFMQKITAFASQCKYMRLFYPSKLIGIKEIVRSENK